MATVKANHADVTSVPINTGSLHAVDPSRSDFDSDGTEEEEARLYLKKLIREDEERERARRVRVLSKNAEGSQNGGKRRRVDSDSFDGTLAPLEPETAAEKGSEVGELALSSRVSNGGGKQFWKAGDYEYVRGGDLVTTSAGMDHVRVHPRFLHSNATSHKWVLGAFAELLDNALDEVCNGATYVNIDTLANKKDENPMLIVEDNGGGMDPDKMRQCMSLGYSAKSRIANTIGQYGNGFKTSTMRLGADVIVFSRCRGKDGKRPTQSIGLLSYTFLTKTGKEDIVVPMLDYEKGAGNWMKLIRSTQNDWDKNVDTIVRWSPFTSEDDLLCQLNLMTDHGTRVIIFNLWEDDQGKLELDFEADKHDIQIRGVNRDEKNIQMATQYPNSWHFLTYRHSLRSYASILYLRLPEGFRIILRGRDIEHHNIINDLMHTQEITYRPQPQPDTKGVPPDSNMLAVVTLGFVKDAIHHIDVQGFNVYHKNRLIKPFWRLWNACGSDGRGVIGLLEANFVEPAHDKQGFERTTVLSRLESRLVQMQKRYWTKNCQLVGYVQRGGNKVMQSVDSVRDGNSHGFYPKKSSQYKNSGVSSGVPSPEQRPDKSTPQSNHASTGKDFEEPHKSLNGNGLQSKGHHSNRHHSNGNTSWKVNSRRQPSNNRVGPFPTTYSSSSDMTEDLISIYPNGTNQRPAPINSDCSHDSFIIDQLNEENRVLMMRIQEQEERKLSELQLELKYERDLNMSLQAQIEQVETKIKDVSEEQNELIDIFSEERERRVAEEESLKKQLEEAFNSVQELTKKIAQFERKQRPGAKVH